MSDRADRDHKDSDHLPVAGILPLVRVTEHEDFTLAVRYLQ